MDDTPKAPEVPNAPIPGKDEDCFQQLSSLGHRANIQQGRIKVERCMHLHEQPKSCRAYRSLGCQIEERNVEERPLNIERENRDAVSRLFSSRDLGREWRHLFIALAISIASSDESTTELC